MRLKRKFDGPARLPKIGVIRKGSPKVNGKWGKDLDHFRFDAEVPGLAKEQQADLETRFAQLFGEEPKEILIRLPFATVDENFMSGKEKWNGKGELLHRCDGETCVLWRTPDGDISTTPKPCPGGCKAVMRLTALVPSLGYLGAITVLSTAVHDAVLIGETLDAYETLLGDLRHTEFVLSRAPRTITRDVDGKKKRLTKSLLTLRALGDALPGLDDGADVLEEEEGGEEGRTFANEVLALFGDVYGDDWDVHAAEVAEGLSGGEVDGLADLDRQALVCAKKIAHLDSVGWSVYGEEWEGKRLALTTSFKSAPGGIFELNAEQLDYLINGVEAKLPANGEPAF